MGVPNILDTYGDTRSPILKQGVRYAAKSMNRRTTSVNNIAFT